VERVSRRKVTKKSRDFTQRLYIAMCQGIRTNAMKLRYINPLLFTAILLYLAGCTKEDQIADKTITVKYAQTQCADPWGYGTDNVVINKLRNYMDSAQLSAPLLSIMIKQENDMAACLACTCPTGKVIYVSLMASDELKQKLLKAGFKEK
jgi:hypothetical protein